MFDWRFSWFCELLVIFIWGLTIIRGSLEDTSELRRVEKRCDWKVKSKRCDVHWKVKSKRCDVDEKVKAKRCDVHWWCQLQACG